MSSNKTLSKLTNGVSGPYVPKSLDGIEIYIGATVILPEPNETDMWNHGNFSATVEDCDDQTGDLLVIDAEGDYWAVEPDRVLVNGELSFEELAAFEKIRDDAKAEQAALDAEAEAVQQSKDEKNGLYPDKIDVAN